jgi:hypothetical protein
VKAKGVGKDFLSRHPAAQQLKGKDGQIGLHEIKKLCTTKEMISKLKRPPTEWEKIFATYTEVGISNRDRGHHGRSAGSNILLSQIQGTPVQRLSPENKGILPYIPLQSGYRNKK